MQLKKIWMGLPIIMACTPDYELSKRELGDVFYQLDAGAVDILLVVDNSCSMQPYQQELANNFDSFLTYFIEGDVDYQIGVATTTVIAPEPYGGCTASDIAAVPLAGSLVDNMVVTADTPNASQVFSDLVNVGTCGAGMEMGLEAALQVLENPSAGLLREEAYLSVIFVSDEEDASPLPVNNYINDMRAIKDATAREVYNASSLVVTDASRCNATQLASGATLGSRYLDVAQQSEGIQVNICAEDFASIVTDLSLNSSRLNDVFFLNETPDLSTLIVSLDTDDYSSEVPCDSEDYPWTYEEIDVAGDAQPTIRFERSSLPPTGAKISVEYNIAYTAEQEFTCGGE
jgi:hypothetical protein